jgi:hypothetical protein
VIEMWKQLTGPEGNVLPRTARIVAGTRQLQPATLPFSVHRLSLRILELGGVLAEVEQQAANRARWMADLLAAAGDSTHDSS